MEYIIISIAALVVAALTLFSGFGLGSLLMPVFALFFPVELAVAATAVVHLANNIFKVFLVGRRADWKVVAIFTIPAALFAMLGAWLLGTVSGSEPIVSYQIGSRVCQITTMKLVIAVIIFAFSLFEFVPILKRINLGRRWLPLGGALSGFFGGLSGHQGALRTVFLVRLGLSKEVFIGTVVLSAVIVDIFRVSVYGVTFLSHSGSLLSGQAGHMIVVGIVAAFIGSFIGSRLVKKITLQTVHAIVGVMLVAFSIALGMGVI